MATHRFGAGLPLNVRACLILHGFIPSMGSYPQFSQDVEHPTATVSCCFLYSQQAVQMGSYRMCPLGPCFSRQTELKVS